MPKMTDYSEFNLFSYLQGFKKDALYRILLKENNLLKIRQIR
ncbi:hypothetical protein SAMD00020551_5002 [Mesobacillus selenatarsenatis SF-1]|uniref:Uncharacterized protein n=1 Tax=Mesobacillus selenatarsenatis (strain DSM 18680 / JCM 14380 / FERM P-15431 / SF-1) TaxID=1321606 RepID=A0A0A8XCM7_MESS1|nr:hypothetical protein SAMD00020551_5002 [Mesobacillus selenatarsenatis SF-1]